MNLLPCLVTEVLSEPKEYILKAENFTWWEVLVEYDCYGVKGRTALGFKSKSEAESVKVGYEWEG